MTALFDTARTRLTLGRLLKRGGEGGVYLVAGRPGLLAKVYHSDKPPNPGKLAWMRDHPPADPAAALGHVSIAWPRDLLFDEDGRCRGFLMVHVEQTAPILHVFNPRLRARFGLDFDEKYLHRTAHNLAAAVSAVHARDYVVGDVNESNVLVTPSALVTLIDTDSFQVRERGGPRPAVHRCLVGKPEYTPPELHGVSFAEVVREPHHDAFGLAVLLFQLLMEGSHPFRADWRGQGDSPSLVAKIELGMYPYQKPPPPQIGPPAGAPPLDILHPELAFLFRRCFGDGHHTPCRRPAAAEWATALARAEHALLRCPNDHYLGDHLPSCPRCGARVTARQVALPSARSTPRDQTGTIPSPPSPSRVVPARPPDSTGAFSPPRPRLRRPGVAPWWSPLLVGVAALIVVTGVVVGGRAMLAGTGGIEGPPAAGIGDRALTSVCWPKGPLAASSMDESGEGSRLLQWSAPPVQTIDPARRYAATLETSAGIIEVELLPEQAPLAVNNFVCLARAGFYDGTVFHRIVPGAIVQGGDPTGTGAGGPGYRFPDEGSTGDYRPGALSMANSGPDTNGSQFFIAAADLSDRLPPRYTIFGQVSRGQLVVDAIAAEPLIAGTDGKPSTPAAPMTLERVLITEG